MQTDKKSSKNWLKLVETIGLIIVPLVIVLAGGLWLRSLAAQPVAQAKSVPAQLNENTPTSLDGVPNLGTIQGNEIPNSSFDSISVNGITIYAGNYRLKDSQLWADICFDMIDNSDWIIWHSWDNHVVDVQGHEASITSASVIEIRYLPVLIDGKLKQFITDGNIDHYRDAVPDQKVGQRCDTIRYTLPADFDPSQFTMTINSIARNPDEADICGADDTPYMQKIQAALDKKKTGIKIKSAYTNGDGVCGIEVIQKPNNMSQKAAQDIATDNEMQLDIFGIRGPWVFEGSIK